MALLTIDQDNALYYDYTPPSADNGVCFVFFNALTGDSGLWRELIVPRLAPHGALLWHYRGQPDSRVADGVKLDDRTLSGDARRLLDELAPPRPVLVGLSIGGLFAAQAVLAGSEAAGLVLVNTLRRPGARLDWVNEAALRAAELGGLTLIKDLFAPLIFNRDWLADNRAGAFADRNYAGLAPGDGHYRLLDDCRDADWLLDYAGLKLPTLVLSGLQDDMFFDPDDVAELAARLPQARRVDFPDAGHMLPLERPQAFAEHLLEFARGL